MKKIVFITPQDAEFGFGLAGIRHQVADAGETQAVLQSVMAEPDIGLVILDERLFSGPVEEQVKEEEPAWGGILLVLPSPEKLPAEAEDYAARLIRRAIGYHVRLNV
jgi:V/A-type H+-transporting ATPase subunit F